MAGGEHDRESDPTQPETPEEIAGYAAASVTPGGSIGRFELGEVLGRGGMGVVLVARDPQLDRRVAIKLLHALPGDAGSRGRERLLREARALARISHPNVVTVYEAGVVGDQVFVVMELVDGENLRRWLPAHPGWRERLAALVAAGRGLAAAHAAGLVHRDVKAENIFVGRDGRARIGDFGLVAIGREAEAPATPGADSLETRVTLTVDGAVLGTPRYMAPEQLRGAGVDARADQFAWCVTAYEALYGRHPFPAGNAAELAERIDAGPPPPPGSEVPRWVHAAIARGLRADPATRWPSMEALLQALSRGDSAGRWVGSIALLALAGAVIAVAVAAVTVRGGSGRGATAPSAACAEAGARVDELAAPESRAALVAAVTKAPLPGGEQAGTRAGRRLDEQVDGLRRATVSACEAAAGAPAAERELAARRQVCLEQRRRELGELTGAIVSGAAGLQSGEAALRALLSLPPASACSDPTVLAAVELLPPEPVAAVKVARLRVRLDRAWARKRLSRYDESRTLAEAVLEEARALGRGGVAGEALVLLAQLDAYAGDYAAAEQRYSDAAVVAAEARAEYWSAEAHIGLLEIVGYRLRRHEAADSLLPVARGAVARAGNSARQRADLLAVEGMLLAARGKYREELVVEEQALTLFEEAVGPDSPAVASVLNNLGLTYKDLAEYDKSRRALTRALAIWEQAYGTESNNAADTLHNLCVLEDAVGDLETAWSWCEKALAAKTRIGGRRAPSVAATLGSMAGIRLGQGRAEEALALFQENLEILVESLGPEHPRVAITTANIGATLLSLGRVDEARAAHERALALKLKKYGEEHTSVAYSYEGLAKVELAAGRGEAARAHARRAAAIRRKRLGERHPDVAAMIALEAQVEIARGRCDLALPLLREARAMVEAGDGGAASPALVGLLAREARCLVRGGRAREALPLAERALALASAAAGERPSRALALFALAEAKRASGGDAGEARGHAEEALALFTALGPGAEEERREVERWLRKN